ncbi:acid-sensing ion channel 3 [Caerostris extrusa]|uniref:Acid-sensing ion channel 3 n=1 Tax=Caerostris extrusa TaxID=172846 RepID=A0AAV4PMT7_CAEEX|nr:acid-sensing ion channel 3 [Caerostris extrusa]
MEYPVVVTINRVQEKSLEFPAISICNLNRMKQDESGTNIDFHETHQTGTPLILTERTQYSQCKKDQNSTTMSDDDINVSTMKSLKEYYETAEAKRFVMGRKLSDFMKECLFNGKLCPKNSLNNLFSLRYGYCFTFNKKTQDLRPLYVSQTGIGTGLNIKLNLDTLHYMKISHTRGAIMVIHNPRDPPNPEEDGYILSPGFETSVSIKHIMVHRLPAPFKDRCIDYKRKPLMASKNDCIRTCIQEHNFAKCHCIDPTLSIPSPLRLCNLLNKTEMCCLDDVLKDLTEYGPICDCPLPCVSTYYDAKLSRALLSKALMMSWREEMYYASSGGIKGYMEENLRLNVFYEDLGRMVYKQRPKFEGTEFLSYLGNQLGFG